MRKFKFWSIMFLITSVSISIVGCSKGRDTVFSENTVKENKFNIKGEEYIKTIGIEENQVFQSFYYENGYIYGAVRTLVDKNNNIVEKDIEKNKNLSSNYLRIMENKIYKMDGKGKISGTEREIFPGDGEKEPSIDELNVIVREGNLRYLDHKGILGTFGYNDEGEVGILEFGKIEDGLFYKFSEKYSEKIKDGRYPSTEFIDLEQRYLVSTFFNKKTEGNFDEGPITDVVIVDREENKEYILYEENNLEFNKYLDDFSLENRIAYNKKNDKFFIFSDSGIVKELQFKDGKVNVITKADFKGLIDFFNVNREKKIKFASMDDKIVVYNSEGAANGKLLFIYNVKSNSGRPIAAESDGESKIYEVFESREMLLIGPRDSSLYKGYLLVDLKDDSIVKAHQFYLKDSEDLGHIYTIEENGKITSIMIETLKRKDIEYDKNIESAEEESTNNNLINLYESIDYLRLILE